MVSVMTRRPPKSIVFIADFLVIGRVGNSQRPVEAEVNNLDSLFYCLGT